MYAGPDPGVARDNRTRLERALRLDRGALLFMTQTHSTQVVAIGDPQGGLHAASSPAVPPEADGMVSVDGRTPLAVLVADCVPVILASTSGATGVVHAGRQGLFAGIIPVAVASMASHGSGALRAWIGPSICGQCYEVPQPMAQELSKLIPAARARTRHGTPALDLRAAVHTQLTGLGVEVEPLEGAGNSCTFENTGLYSHRREPGAGRIAGLVWRQ